MAVPGLLACLALRYDASRATNMRARAAAAAQAITGSLAGMQVCAARATACPLRSLFELRGLGQPPAASWRHAGLWDAVGASQHDQCWVVR